MHIGLGMRDVEVCGLGRRDAIGVYAQMVTYLRAMKNHSCTSIT